MIPDKLEAMGYTEEDLDESNPFNLKESDNRMNSDQLREHLSHFYGTEYWYRHPLHPDMLFTDGVRAFCDAAGGYWFMDIIATEVFKLQATEAFLNIILAVTDSSCTIRVDDGNGNLLWGRNVEWTDCPEGEWQFFLTDHVLLLPSEY